MRRIALLLAILTLGLVAACGSGGDDDSSAGSPDSTSSSDSSGSGGAAGGGAGSAFCSPTNEDVIFGSLDFTRTFDDLEAQFGLIGDALDVWAGSAPAEIEGDVRILVDAMRALIELFEEFDFDLVAIGTAAADDSRLTTLDSDAFQAATVRISEYCGYDIATSSTGSAAPSGSESGGDGGGSGFAVALPDDFPAELVPPDSELEIVSSFGPSLTVQFSSTATIDEILAFYEDALGEPSIVSDEFALWSIFETNKITTVNVTGTDGNLEIVISIASS